MRQRLQRSNYIFSGMKTFHELNEAFPSLIDENGNRKPFERFLNDVQKIDRTYNHNYLRAEYNFAQTSATMAAKWEGFMHDGDRYNLQYRTLRMGHKSILRDESKKGDKGKTLSCLDIDLDDTIMDIASITKGDVYGYALMGKNSQLRRAREQSGDISDAVMLYFHQPDMFTEEKMQRDLQWYKNRVIEVGTAQRIHHVYVVINGAEEIKHYEI